MLGGTALYALIWTRFIRRAPLFEPTSVERVLQAESGASDRNCPISAATAS